MNWLKKNIIFETIDAEFFENIFSFEEKFEGPSNSFSVLPRIREESSELEEAKDLGPPLHLILIF